MIVPSDGEAVSENAGQGDWGGFPSWDLPQEEQEQDFVEGKYTPGSEYDPGFIPEDKLYDEDGEIEMPPEYVGKAGTGVGDNEIEMPAEFSGGQAGVKWNTPGQAHRGPADRGPGEAIHEVPSWGVEE